MLKLKKNSDQTMKKIKFKIGFNAKIDRFIKCFLFNIKNFVLAFIFLLLARNVNAKIGKNSFSKKQSSAYSSMYGPKYQADHNSRNDCNELDSELLYYQISLSNFEFLFSY